MSIDIDAILDRANAATPGPWYSDNSDNMDDAGNHYSVMYGDGWYLARIWNDLKQSNYVADAAFIAAARSDVPALCEYARATDARAERAEAALEQARAALEEIANSLEADGGAPLSLAVAKAALLAAAPGGAELDAALSDMTMRPRTGAGGAE